MIIYAEQQFFLNLIQAYSSPCNLTPPISWVLIGQPLIFSLTSPTCCNSPRKCTPVKYKARQKAGFQIVTYTTFSIALRDFNWFRKHIEKISNSKDFNLKDSCSELKPQRQGFEKFLVWKVIASDNSNLLRKVVFLLKSNFQVTAIFIFLEVGYLVVNFIYKWKRQIFLVHHKIMSDWFIFSKYLSECFNFVMVTWFYCFLQ